MTEKEGKKHLISIVPAILTGSAALIAALTTTYVSLRNDKSPASVKAQVVAEQGTQQATPPASAAAPKVSVSRERQIELKIERIAVHSDGTAGTTDWRFAVEVDDEPRFAFEQDRLTDEGGRNVVVPETATTTLQLAEGKPAKITVKAWRNSALRAELPHPDAQGQGRLGPDGKSEPIHVSAAEQDRGAFTFYFSAATKPNEEVLQGHEAVAER